MKNKIINNKGFTLIELLAVIVILAVVMVVTIPSVVSSMNNAKIAQFNNAMDGVSQWLTKQYGLAALNLDTSSEYAEFVEKCKRTGNEYIFSPGYNYAIFDKQNKSTSADCEPAVTNMLKAAGIANPSDDIDLDNTYFYQDGNKIEVIGLPKENGQFYVNDYKGVDNIFDMRVLTSAVNTDGNKLLTYNGDGFQTKYGALRTRYSGNRCGLIMDKSATCPDPHLGMIFSFKSETQYKVSWNVTLNGANAPRLYIVYYTSDGTTDSEFADLGDTETKEITSDSGKTIKYISFYSAAADDTNLITIKEFKIKEV